MEIKKEVKVFIIRQYCDICIDIELEDTGHCFTSFPPMYQHQCPKCLSTESFKNRYPKNTYEEIG